jgi:hypothetical protein
MGQGDARRRWCMVQAHLHSGNVPTYGDLATGCRGRRAGGLVVGCSHAGRWRLLSPLAALCTPSCGARVGGTRGVVLPLRQVQEMVQEIPEHCCQGVCGLGGFEGKPPTRLRHAQLPPDAKVSHPVSLLLLARRDVVPSEHASSVVVNSVCVWQGIRVGHDSFTFIDARAYVFLLSCLVRINTV